MMTGGDTITGVAGGPAGHTPVLLKEVIELLAPAAGGLYVDGTFGRGGYTRAILAAGGRVLAIDRDPDAIAAGSALRVEFGDRLTLVQGRFGELDRIAEEQGFAPVDGVVLDIGVSSPQVDDPERGFSFMKDGPLDMRMERHGPSAADIVNRMEEGDLRRIIAVLGEERKAGAVVRAIAAARGDHEIKRTGELAGIVEKAIGRRPTDPIHPATRTFQALRIFVNDELEELARGLAAAERILKGGGRLVVVAFHSLEDRIVKRFLTERSRARPATSRHQPMMESPVPSFTPLTRGAVTAGGDEVASNPRARSAKLRAAMRTAAPAHGFDRAALGLPALPTLAGA
jgi:16S rRNA (cytosine1402-N4)-methyltransferase